jgi:2-amino-4-hydroxy-6-hydroxymethyldihydropteridine diphosphokinase
MIVLGIGSNLGNRVDNILNALNKLAETKTIRLVSVSSLYETEPVGFKDQPSFINAAALVETELSPFQLLEACLDIEQYFGRIRNQRWGPRVIDIDLLMYGQKQICTKRLILPHPHMHQRRFVLVPLNEIIPTTPIRENLTASELLLLTEDSSGVKLYRKLLLQEGKVSLV